MKNFSEKEIKEMSEKLSRGEQLSILMAASKMSNKTKELFDNLAHLTQRMTDLLNDEKFIVGALQVGVTVAVVTAATEEPAQIVALMGHRNGVKLAPKVLQEYIDKDECEAETAV